jgi:hypothetical protein
VSTGPTRPAISRTFSSDALSPPTQTVGRPWPVSTNPPAPGFHEEARKAAREARLPYVTLS